MKNSMPRAVEGDKANATATPRDQQSRRSWLGMVGLGTVLAALVGQGYAFLRSLVPNVLYEPPERFKVGLPEQFPDGATFLEDRRVFIFREKGTFYAISATCTHLGCTVKMLSLSQPRRVKVSGVWVEERREFRCPCHGSKYHGDGTNYAGPAPKPLTWYQLEVAPEDGQLVVNLSQPVSRSFRLTA